VTGLAYAVGFLAQLTFVDKYYIPVHLLPDFQVHQTIVFGAIYLIFYLSIGLFIYLLYIYLQKRFTRLRIIEDYFHSRLSSHRIAFPLFLLLIASTVLILVPLYVSSPAIGRRILKLRNMPRVVELQTHNQTPIIDANSWCYISRRNGLIVLGQMDKKRYMLIREEHIDKLIIEISEK
jgi:hypothetical protein